MAAHPRQQDVEEAGSGPQPAGWLCFQETRCGVLGAPVLHLRSVPGPRTPERGQPLPAAGSRPFQGSCAPTGRPAPGPCQGQVLKSFAGGAPAGARLQDARPLQAYSGSARFCPQLVCKFFVLQINCSTGRRSENPKLQREESVKHPNAFPQPGTSGAGGGGGSALLCLPCTPQGLWTLGLSVSGL